LKIVRNTKTGKFYNAWNEGDKIILQDLRTGRVTKAKRGAYNKNRGASKYVHRETKDMKAARKYANGED